MLRSRLKKIMPEGVWPFLRWVDKYIIHSMYGYFILRLWPARKQLNALVKWRQSILTYNSKIDLATSRDIGISQVLEYEGVTYKSGRHSVYVSGESEIKKICDSLVQRYPQPFGIKIIKSQEISPDGTPFYTSSVLAPASTNWSMKAIGSVLEKGIVANLLHQEQVAPRVYDLIKLKSEGGSACFAQIVEHIEGPVVYGSKGEKFVEKFKSVLRDKGMMTASIAEHCDLRAPSFRDNIVTDGNQIYYVDIQNFILSETSKINLINKIVVERYGRDLLSSMLLQTPEKIKGKPSDAIEVFCSRVEKLLSDIGISLSETVVVDICQGVGAVTMGLLSRGLFWGYLSRSAEECPALRSWWYLSGFSRFDCIDGKASTYPSSLRSSLLQSRTIGVVCDNHSIPFERVLERQCADFALVFGEKKISPRVVETLLEKGYWGSHVESIEVNNVKLEVGFYRQAANFEN